MGARLKQSIVMIATIFITITLSVLNLNYRTSNADSSIASQLGITIFSPQNGALVSGTIEITGEINDPRGINALFYEINYPDGASDYHASQYLGGPGETYFPFELTIDTKVGDNGRPFEFDGEFEVTLGYSALDWVSLDDFDPVNSIGAISENLTFYTQNKSDFSVEISKPTQDRYYDTSCPINFTVDSPSGKEIKSVWIYADDYKTIYEDYYVNSSSFQIETSWDTELEANGEHYINFIIEDEEGWKTKRRARIAVMHEHEIKSSFYFAEGYTGFAFDTYLSFAAAIPDMDETTIIIFMFESGEKLVYPLGFYEDIISVNSIVGSEKNVSTEVISDAIITVERPTYFDYKGKWPGGHSSTGALSPDREWYFAEGNTRQEFEQWICVQNPNPHPVTITLGFMIAGEGLREFYEKVPPTSRATFLASSYIGFEKDTSLKVSADCPIVAERSMYFEYKGLQNNSWQGGHNVVGATAPDTQWYFAEGTTRNGFEEWLTLQNPNPYPIDITINYQLGVGQGTKSPVTHNVPAFERKNVSVNYEVGLEKDVSAYLVSEHPFLVERPMYFRYTGYNAPGWEGGHVVMGTKSENNHWLFAPSTSLISQGDPGATSDWNEKQFNTGQHVWLCIQNPGTKVANVSVKRYRSFSDTEEDIFSIPPNSRFTMITGSCSSEHIRVDSDQPIIVEKPCYFNWGLDTGYGGGYDVIGCPCQIEGGFR